MRVVVTGATGLIGSRLVSALAARGDAVVALSRDPAGAAARLGVEAVGWDDAIGALSGADAVVHLAGERIDQRWTDQARERIRASREEGTARLVEALRAAAPRPAVLVSASGVGFYGPRGDERLEEDAAPGDDFVAEVCRAWEGAALEARALGVRVVLLRTGVVLSPSGGALARMLPFFRAGVGGPVAGGAQYLSWIALDDLVGLYLAALDDPAWEGPVNATAPEPVTNRELSRALGRALHRPAVLPVPGVALRGLYGEMASIVTTGQRAVPARAQALGFRHAQADLDAALRAAVAHA